MVRYINQPIMTRKVNYILDADIRGFFDNLDQKWLMKFLEHDIAEDKTRIIPIGRFKGTKILISWGSHSTTRRQEEENTASESEAARRN